MRAKKLQNELKNTVIPKRLCTHLKKIKKPSEVSACSNADNIGFYNNPHKRKNVNVHNL